MEHRKLKVLISAYGCEPDRGSEPGVGWNWAKQAARFHEVWVITSKIDKLNQNAIEEAMKKEPSPDIHWVYFDLPRWICNLLVDPKWGWRMRFYYFLWQIGIYFLGKKLNKEIKFNLVNHVTTCCYWTPSFLCLLGIPFIWGPVGGGENTPKTFIKSFSYYGIIYELLRGIARWFGEKDVFVGLCARKANLILTSTEATAERIKKLGARNIQIYSQIGLNKDEINELQHLSYHGSPPFRVVSIGRLLHWKGFHLSLKGFARFYEKFPDSEYWFIGNGPEEQNLKKLSCKLGISKSVYFLDNRPRHEVLKKLEECNILLHPSLHDSAGLVCLEAMAAGKPVICLDTGGPALQVTDETGFKIPALNPEQAVKDLSEAMIKLAQNNELRLCMSEAGRKRVAEYFDWDKKGEFINSIYQEIVL